MLGQYPCIISFNEFGDMYNFAKPRVLQTKQVKMNMANLKAVIPVAGLGMHMLPATKAIPKEMLPIVDKPMIQYIVDEIVAAGIKEIVLGRTPRRMRWKPLDTSYELEALLEQRVKRQLLAEVQPFARRCNHHERAPHSRWVWATPSHAPAR